MYVFAMPKGPAIIIARDSLGSTDLSGHLNDILFSAMFGGAARQDPEFGPGLETKIGLRTGNEADARGLDRRQ